MFYINFKCYIIGASYLIILKFARFICFHHIVYSCHIYLVFVLYRSTLSRYNHINLSRDGDELTMIVLLCELNLSYNLHKLAGNEAHYSIIKQGQFVHLDDLCLAHIFLFEQPKVEGRYICCACEANIHHIAKLINTKYPEYNVPTK